jgi:predicted lipid-binding transport protein (Tim44 family)
VSMGVSSRIEPGRAVGMTWQRARSRSDDRAARQLQAAEHDAEVAAARYRALKEAAAAPASANGDRRPMPSWQQMLLLVVGGGILTGLLIIWLLATAYIGPAALLALPTAAGLVAGFIVLRRRRPQPVAPRRPLVADLVRAAQEMHEAEAALQRLRQECS